MTGAVDGSDVFVSTDSASAAIEMLTSELRGQEKRFARSFLSDCAWMPSADRIRSACAASSSLTIIRSAFPLSRHA